MDEKFKHILNDDSQNNPFCRLQLVVEILRHSLIKIQEKSSKLLIRKRYYKTLGTSVINNPMSSPSPCCNESDFANFDICCVASFPMHWFVSNY